MAKVILMFKDKVLSLHPIEDGTTITIGRHRSNDINIDNKHNFDVDNSGWTFTSDPFADLWFHGLAIVGFDGFGRVPLYDAEYAWNVESSRRADAAPSELERARGEILAAFISDPAFEVLHFVPLYLADAPVDMALDALEHLGDAGGGRTDARVARESAALAAVLATPSQRGVVADFVRALRGERAAVAAGRARGFDLRASGVASLWADRVEPPLGAFLERYGCRSSQRSLYVPRWGEEPRQLRSMLETPGNVLPTYPF